MSLSIGFSNAAFPENFYLDSRNRETLRFELNNDVIWDRDSNFTNGWSLQYYTACYANWEETKAPGFIRWVGKHFPTLDNPDSIVRIGHSIGQSMITPGDLSTETQQEGDLPYAGTLTYSLSWQSFNRREARVLQVTAGVMGESALAKPFQRFVHNHLVQANDPKGWDTQRDTEPIFNVGYLHSFRLAHAGIYNNDFAGQLSLTPSVSLGNLLTATELALALRFGWNILEGFANYPSPPGRGFFQSSSLPKPPSASPHGIELTLGVRGTWLVYSVIYDGSIITGDDRSVDRNNLCFTAAAGIHYHYYDVFSIQVTFQKSTDLLKKASIPQPPPGIRQTEPDSSFGSLIFNFYF